VHNPEKYKEVFMSIIKSINCRKVFNSHVKFTNEFIIEFDDGSVGTGSSSEGETISIYEDRNITIDPGMIIQKIQEDGYFGRSLDQASFDDYLESHVSFFGRNNVNGLSLAFFNAVSLSASHFVIFNKPQTKMTAPRICLNILNGGWHAYTNPVLSDFHEYILVSKSNNPEELVAGHSEIQRVVKEKQLSQSKTVVSGNPVNSFSVRDNRAVIEFLLDVVNGLGLSDKYDLMIDASAGDLWADEGYRMMITDNSVRSSEKFCEYWLDLIRQYDIRFLEDPFHEKDFESWQRLTASQST
jgi:enolase